MSCDGSVNDKQKLASQGTRLVQVGSCLWLAAT